MNVKNNVISLSGGKDSTAMLLMMLERGEPVHSAVFLDTGWEFPQMHDHIQKLTAYVWDRYRVKTWTIHHRLPFEYIMIHKPIIARKGLKKGQVHLIGNGWPSVHRRWCTREKIDQIDHFKKAIPGTVSCIGYGADEVHRVKKNKTDAKRFPLIEYGVTEAEALKYCYEHGFDWGGLYEIFGRVSCFCCPLQTLSGLRNTRKHFPYLWTKMLEWDAMMPPHYHKFNGNISVIDLDRRFAEEDRQGDLFPEMENELWE